MRAKRGLRGDVEADPHALDHAPPVFLSGEVIVQDARLRAGVRGAQGQLAAACRLEHAGSEHDAVSHRAHQPLLADEAEIGGHRVNLDVRRFEIIARAEKPTGLGDVGGKRPSSFA